MELSGQDSSDESVAFISLDGRLGSGKTYFLEMFKSLLEDARNFQDSEMQEADPVEGPWAYDFLAAPFISYWLSSWLRIENNIKENVEKGKTRLGKICFEWEFPVVCSA